MAASDNTWLIEMKCAFPGPTATRCCSVLLTKERLGIRAMIFTVRRSALHGLCDRNSVRPSVCPSVTLSLHPGPGLTQPSILSGSPRARALNEGGVGTNW